MPVREFNPDTDCGAVVKGRDPEWLAKTLRERKTRLAATPVTDRRYERIEDSIKSFERKIASIDPDRPLLCMLKKGNGTSHVGNGYCSHHCECKGDAYFHVGLSRPHKYSKIKNKRIVEKIAEIRTHGEGMELVSMVQLLEAVTLDFLDKTGEDGLTSDQLGDAIKLAETIGKMVERVHTLRLKTAVAFEVVEALQERMAAVVLSEVKDPDLIQRIMAGWSKIHVESGMKKLAAGI